MLEHKIATKKAPSSAILRPNSQSLDSGDKVDYDIELSYQPARLHVPVRQPYAKVNFIPQSGTKNLATGTIRNVWHLTDPCTFCVYHKIQVCNIPFDFWQHLMYIVCIVYSQKITTNLLTITTFLINEALLLCLALLQDPLWFVYVKFQFLLSK